MMLTTAAKYPIESPERGDPMSELTKRGSILCQRCGTRRRERVCPSCGWDACAIRISIDGKYIRLYKGRDRKAFSYTAALESLIRINRDLKDGIFDTRNWVEGELEKKRFRYLWGVWIGQKEKAVESGRFAPETLRIYLSYYRNHYQTLAPMDIREIQLKHLQGLVDGLAVSQKYTKNLMDCLKTFFAWAVKWEGDVKLPIFPEIEITRGEQQTAITYEAQIEAINNIPPQHRDIFIFMRECALRVSEGCAVKIKDLDLPNRRVIVQRTYSGNVLSERTKGRNRLWLPLSGAALEVAERNSKDRFGEDFLFINPESGRGYRAAALRRYWNLYAQTDVCVHEGIRHSTISDWSRSANAFQVKELARHSDIKTSQIYVHNALSDLKGIVNRDNVISIRSDADPIEAKSGK